MARREGRSPQVRVRQRPLNIVSDTLYRFLYFSCGFLSYQRTRSVLHHRPDVAGGARLSVALGARSSPRKRGVKRISIVPGGINATTARAWPMNQKRGTWSERDNGLNFGASRHAPRRLRVSGRTLSIHETARARRSGIREPAPEPRPGPYRTLPHGNTSILCILSYTFSSLLALFSTVFLPPALKNHFDVGLSEHTSNMK